MKFRDGRVEVQIVGRELDTGQVDWRINFDLPRHMGTWLEPADARAIAAYLIRCADEIEDI